MTATNLKRDARMNRDAYRMVDGWYCMVAGQVYGPWALKGYAQAGYEVELHRAEQRRSRGR